MPSAPRLCLLADPLPQSGALPVASWIRTDKVITLHSTLVTKFLRRVRNHAPGLRGHHRAAACTKEVECKPTASPCARYPLWELPWQATPCWASCADTLHHQLGNQALTDMLQGYTEGHPCRGIRRHAQRPSALAQPALGRLAGYSRCRSQDFEEKTLASLVSTARAAIKLAATCRG